MLLLRCVVPGEAPYWMIPGGGREEGEDETACVVREAREETRLVVEVERLLLDVPADPPDGTYVRWRTYLCRLVGGEAAPGTEGPGAQLVDVMWLPLGDEPHWPAEISSDPFLEPQLRAIRDRLGAAPRGQGP